MNSLGLRKSYGRAVTLLGLAGMLAPLPGCQSITGSTPVSQVRLVDVSPDANAGQGLDVYQGSNLLASNVGFTTKTSYVQVTPGNYAIQADAAGSRTVLATQSGTFQANAQYTVLISDYSVGLQETIYKDQSQAAPSGQIEFRILDQATHSGTVDIYLIPSGATILTVKPFLTGVYVGQNTGYVSVPAGTYTVVALPAGTTPTATGTTSYSGSLVSYGSGSVTTLVLADQQVITTPGLQVIALTDYSPIGATQ